MGALKQKMVLAILLCTILTACIVGGISILTVNHMIEESSRRDLQFHCTQTGQQINVTLDSIERATQVVYHQEMDRLLEHPEILHDSQAMKQNLAQMEQVLLSQAKHTPGCVGVYIHYSPEYSGQGIYYMRTLEGEELRRHELTDVQAYAPEDTEHVGWYYQPLKAGHPIWLSPYRNSNIDRYLVSYVIPVYFQGKTVGIMGMDISFSFLETMVKNISLYSSGYAFLVQDGKIIVHRDYPIYTDIDTIDAGREKVWKNVLKSTDETKEAYGEYRYHDMTKSFSSTGLHNDMTLFICAPQQEIYQESHQLLLRLLGILFVAVLCMVVLANALVNHFMKVATQDALTGLPNRSSFLDAYNRLTTSEGNYLLFLLDIDHFKLVNDQYGHVGGDLALQDLGKAMACLSQDNEIVARWGGDEFIGLLQGENAGRRLEAFLQQVRLFHNPGYGTLTLSIGVCAFLPEEDFKESLKRADRALYQAKAAGRNRIFFEDRHHQFAENMGDQ